MIDLLPSATPIEVRARALSTRDINLRGADAAVFVLDLADAGAAIAALPHAALWQRLHERAGRSHAAPVLISRLPDARGTLAVVGFLAASASSYARLELAARLVKAALEPGVQVLQTHTIGLGDATAAAMHEALLSAGLHAAAVLPSAKTNPPAPSSLRRIEVGCALQRSIVSAAMAIAAGNHLARWLTMLPPNVLDCRSYRGALQQLAKQEGWSYRFYGEPALRRLGAGAFLAVSRANSHRGAGIVRLGYRPARAAAAALALVGKGICFDTGGINLKSHKSMYGMHGDMQGSAVAVGSLLALSRLRLRRPIDCWVALTENQTGPDAYRPQEVVTACNGVSIQVVHSDAEGRMVLADTLALAARERPRLIIDYATLTGACVNALTERYSGAFTNRPELQSTLQSVGRECGERVWCFPMDADYDTDLESPIADLMQCTNEGKGDHILAARFLSRFVPDATPWVHLDLAAAERKGGLGHVTSEHTGFGVRYTCHLLGADAVRELREGA